jgi:hypothetical protein
MEEDEVIFKALLQPLIIENGSEVLKKLRLDEDMVELNSDMAVKEEFKLSLVLNKFCTLVHSIATIFFS